MNPVDRYLNEVSPFRLPILARVQRGSSVLDVGAWTGAHGLWLADQRGATVDGIEPNAAAAQRAVGYRAMRVASVEDVLKDGGPGRLYDAILFLDVLEHLVAPERVLREARSWLTPSGVVLVSVPNVAHWRVRLALARGRFEYTDTGLMDRTHLRWFTRATARRLLSGAGYRLTWEDAAVPQHSRIKVPQPLLRPGLFGYQLLFEGAPGATR